jgi:hypothetical protein
MYDEIAMRHLHGGPNDIRGTEWLKRVEEFIKNAQFLSTFLLGTLLRRQYSFGNMLVSSVQSVETQISVPGPNEMSKKLFKVVVKGMMDDCFSDVPPKMIIAEANFINELMTEHAPLLAPYSQQFTDSIKAALPSDIEVSAESSIQGPPKLPGITSTDIDEKGDIVEDEEGNILEDEEGNILEDEEGDIVEDEEGDIHQEDVISPPEQLESKKSVGVFGTITNFFGGVFDTALDTALETETGKKATEVVTILDRQSVLYSNPEIRGKCMLETAENMRKTVELEAQLLAVQLRRIKTKFSTIWSMEKENAAKALHHLCQAACALTFYAGVKILTPFVLPFTAIQSSSTTGNSSRTSLAVSGPRIIRTPYDLLCPSSRDARLTESPRQV